MYDSSIEDEVLADCYCAQLSCYTVHGRSPLEGFLSMTRHDEVEEVPGCGTESYSLPELQETGKLIKSLFVELVFYTYKTLKYSSNIWALLLNCVERNSHKPESL